VECQRELRHLQLRLQSSPGQVKQNADRQEGGKYRLSSQTAASNHRPVSRFPDQLAEAFAKLPFRPDVRRRQLSTSVVYRKSETMSGIAASSNSYMSDKLWHICVAVAALMAIVGQR
jgi:hypothetical protein